MKRYIGYIRVSNKEHENSLPTQRPILEEYAKRRGDELVQIYEEKKSAFGRVNRTIFKKMLEHLKQPNIAGVIFHKVDRSSRNMADFALLESFFESKDIRVIEGEFDTKTAQGRFQFRMFCNMAVWYSENLSEEVNAKMASCLERGYYPGVAYFGYRTGQASDPDPKMKYPNEDAPHVRQVFELYDSGMHSFFSIAKIMRNRGITGASTKAKIERILSNKFYIGVCEWGRTRDRLRTFPGKHQPIISESLFESVAARREGRTTHRGSFGKDPYSRMIRCVCGWLLYPETPTGRNGNRSHSYLRCQNPDCEFRSIRKDDLEDLIVAELSRFEIKQEFFDDYREAMDSMSDMVRRENQQRRKSATLRLSQIEAEMQRVRRGYAKGVYEEDEAVTMKQDLERERTRLMQELDSDATALDAAYFKTAKQFLETFRTIAARYKNATPELKREILEMFFSKRTLDARNLILLPHPLLDEVAVVSNLEDGRDVRPKSETATILLTSIRSIAAILRDQDLAGRVAHLVRSFHPESLLMTSVQPAFVQIDAA